MSNIDARREVHRVIGGAHGTPAMRFPRDPRAADHVVETRRMFLRYAQDHFNGVAWFAARPDASATPTPPCFACRPSRSRG